MIKPVLIVSCLTISYFLVFLMISNHWGQALMIAIYGSLVFSLALPASSFVTQRMPWREFWIANTALILIFGGLEIYAALTLHDSHATRFGGARLSVDGRITSAGFASIAFDIAICTLANFVGFCLARRLIERFNLE